MLNSSQIFFFLLLNNYWLGSCHPLQKSQELSCISTVVLTWPYKFSRGGPWTKTVLFQCVGGSATNQRRGGLFTIKIFSTTLNFEAPIWGATF